MKKKEIHFYRMKRRKLAFYIVNKHQKEGNKQVINNAAKREFRERNRFVSTEKETVRYIIKTKERVGKYSMDKDVPNDENKKKEIKNSMKLYKKMGGDLHIRSTVQSEEDKKDKGDV